MVVTPRAHAHQEVKKLAVSVVVVLVDTKTARSRVLVLKLYFDLTHGLHVKQGKFTTLFSS